ncbi:MAG: hypothetical protein ACD_75C00121G0001, partial [uncultured bacterium]
MLVRRAGVAAAAVGAAGAVRRQIVKGIGNLFQLFRQIGKLQGHEGVLCRLGRGRRQAHGLILQGFFEEVAGKAGVAEAFAALVAGFRQNMAESGHPLPGEVILGFLHEQLGDSAQLGPGEVGEGEIAGKTAFQSRVGVDEIGHEGRVAGHHHDQPPAVVLHEFQQGFNGFPAVVVAAAAALVAAEAVSLVDEQDSVQGRVGDGLGLDRGLAEI